MNVSRKLIRTCVRALVESFNTKVLIQITREIFPDYNIHKQTGFQESISVTQLDAAEQVLMDITENNYFLEFIALLLKAQEEGIMGRNYVLSNSREILREIYAQGYIFDPDLKIFIENPRVQKSRNWGILKEGKDYAFSFLQIDIAGNSKLVKENSQKIISEAYHELRNILREQVEARHGRIWSWEGDGGLAAFYIGNKNHLAVLAAIAILHDLFFYNKLHSKLKSPLNVRIAVHSGPCEYTTEDSILRKSETIRKIGHVEKDLTPLNHISITVVVKEMLDSMLAGQFLQSKQDSGCYQYRLKKKQCKS